MDHNKDHIQRFCRVFEIPDFMKPWLDRFFDKPEIDLVLMLADRPTGPEEIADRIRETDKTELKANVRSFLDRAYKRGIINRLGNFQIQGKGNYTSGQQKRTHANR